MAIKTFSYTDIPLAVRAKTAGAAQRRLQTVLSDPVATPEQRESARRQQTILRQWTSGTLPTDATPSLDDHSVGAPESPQDHTVEVGESLSVEES